MVGLTIRETTRLCDREGAVLGEVWAPEQLPPTHRMDFTLVMNFQPQPVPVAEPPPPPAHL